MTPIHSNCSSIKEAEQIIQKSKRLCLESANKWNVQANFDPSIQSRAAEAQRVIQVMKSQGFSSREICDRAQQLADRLVSRTIEDISYLQKTGNQLGKLDQKKAEFQAKIHETIHFPKTLEPCLRKELSKTMPNEFFHLSEKPSTQLEALKLDVTFEFVPEPIIDWGNVAKLLDAFKTCVDRKITELEMEEASCH